MKEWLKATAITIAVAAAVTGTVVAADTQTCKPESATPQEGTNTVDVVYTMRACGDTVAVFNGDGGTPIIKTDIELVSLREADKRLLRDGITVDSYSDILCLLEDFDS